MHDRRRQQLVDCFFAGVIGGMLLLAAGWFWPPATAPFPGHGERFVAMAQAPFAFDGEIPQRVLWPLLAWLVAKVGIGPLAFSQLCNGFLLAVAVWFARQRTGTWRDAVQVGAAVAASGAVLLYQQPMACYSDSLVLALLVLAVHHREGPLRFWGLVLLAAMGHEMVFHLAPWLLWLRCRAGGSWSRDGALLALTLAGYAAYRVWVSSLAPAGTPHYGFLYYWQKNIWMPWLLPSLWWLWLVTAFAEFGPLLALASLAWLRREADLGGRVGGLLYVGCVASLMLLAYDVMRFATFFGLPVLFGAIALLRLRHGRVLLAGFVVAAVGSYAWQNPVPTDQGGATFTRLQGGMLAVAVPRFPAGGGRMPAADAWDVQGDILRQHGIEVAWTLGLAAALLAAGLMLARLQPVDAAAAGEPRT